MSASLDNLKFMQGPVEFPVSFSSDDGGKEIQGTLDMSANGYIYNIPSKKVVWWKFLALAAYLPIKATMEKCRDLTTRFMGQSPSHNRLSEIQHLKKLANIARKAVAGADGKSLLERVEEFALAELDHHSFYRQKTMDLPRSSRLRTGNYQAPCMQPLFHKSQYTERLPLKMEISELTRYKDDLDAVLYYRNHDGGILNAVSSLFSNYTNPYSGWENAKILAELTYVEGQIQALHKLLNRAQDCQKYALKAILSQQPYCSRAKSTLEDAFVETEDEVRCGGEVCYRKQKICGIIDKVECCGTRCWAIDCFCCACCIWPDARSWCLVV